MLLIGDFVATEHGTAQILNFKGSKLLIATLDKLHTVESKQVEPASFVAKADLCNAWWIKSWYET